MTLLVIRTSALGDVAMTLPAIDSVARQHPDVRLRVLTHQRFAPLFSGCPANVSVLPYDPARHRGFLGFFRLLRLVHAGHVGAVADLHNVFRSWLLDASFLLCGRRVCMLDKRRRERKAILSAHVPTAQPFVMRYFEVFRRLGFPARPTFTRISPDALLPLPTDLPPRGAARWVGIAPFARYQNKTCPLPLMRQVVSQLSAAGAQVFLFGGRGAEAATLAEWAGAIPHVRSVAGKYPLGQELPLMAAMDVMLTMDSANMHLASAVGVRVVSVWGGTTPACGFLGYGQTTADALCANLPCQPCTIAGSDHCPLSTFSCMKTLSPAAIVGKILGGFLEKH